MIEHTPGPWGIDENLEFAVIDNSDTIICQMPYAMTAMQHYANARLIAAAPEMYELLKSIDHALHLDTMNFDATDHRQVYDYAKNIRVLLAKIEGGEE